MQPARPVKIEYEESPRLRNIRFFARLLDQSILLPGGYRIGIDPVIGLIPGIGDLIGTALSLYIVYQAARLGISKSVLLRMSGNVLLEMLIGEIPILGDIFDAVWKANVRNARLVELHHRPTQQERSAKKIFWFMAILFFGILTIGVGAFALLLWVVSKLFTF
jgi:nitrate reductase NapE component